MDVSALLLSRVQFGFTVSFHIIFPSFTIGLAAWLTFLEAMSLATGRAVYRRLFDFWVRIFAVAFGLGVVSGIVMAFQFGTNWNELSRRTGPIQGPLLGYGDTRDHGYRALPPLLAGVLLFLVAAFVTTLALDLRVMRRWLERPELFVFLLAGAAACAGMVRGIRGRRDPLPFWMGVVIFLAAFGTLAVSFLPYMVPFSLTITGAAAPHSTLAFLFWGAGVFVLPVTLAYTVVVYTVFKGKVVPSS